MIGPVNKTNFASVFFLNKIKLMPWWRGSNAGTLGFSIDNVCLEASLSLANGQLES